MVAAAAAAAVGGLCRPGEHSRPVPDPLRPGVPAGQVLGMWRRNTCARGLGGREGRQGCQGTEEEM